VIDVNSHFGPRLRPLRDAPLATLREQADRHGITHSLAYDLGALHADPIGGNRRAIEAAADPGNRLSAVAVLQANRLDLTTADLAPLVRQGVVAFRLALGSREWHVITPANGLRLSATRAVLRAAARTGLPIMIPIFNLGDATVAGEVTADLDVPVILVDAHYIHFVDDVEALRRYPHLHIDTSRFANFMAIEQLVREVGHERLLLGSENPTRCLASPRNAVLAAEISDDAKRAILRDNALRLFNLPASAAGDRDRASALPAPTLPHDAFDVHCHYNPSPWPIPQLADDEVAPALARLGTTGNVASPTVAILSDVVAGNAQGAAAANRATGQYTYLVADPWDLDTTRSQLRAHGSSEGVIGVKVHASLHHMNTSDPRMADLFELLAGHGRPVKIHNEGDDWDVALEAIARRHPRLRIIVAHSGLGVPSLEGARLAAATDNVYLELGSSYADLQVVRELVRITPRHKVLYGTDAPLLNPAFILGTYIDAGLFDDQAVMSDTARHLFGV
jgi:predicted TIM-barrel fold metal-dependent hydrolase